MRPCRRAVCRRHFFCVVSIIVMTLNNICKLMGLWGVKKPSGIHVRTFCIITSHVARSTNHPFATNATEIDTRPFEEPDVRSKVYMFPLLLRPLRNTCSDLSTHWRRLVRFNPRDWDLRPGVDLERPSPLFGWYHATVVRLNLNGCDGIRCSCMLPSLSSAAFAAMLWVFYTRRDSFRTGVLNSTRCDENIGSKSVSSCAM